MQPYDIRKLDRTCVWHPFTPTDAWCSSEYNSVVITSGEGPYLTDDMGNYYLDGNSSIWTNLHGHRHPAIDQAIREQLDRIAHSSFLGLTNDLAPRLAALLCGLASQGDYGVPLTRCFFSDDGSTAIEAAIKIVYQYFQQNDQPQRNRFISLSSGYHGDTVGAMSVGHSQIFHATYRGMLFKVDEIPNPGCYRCHYRKTEPMRSDARSYSSCREEAVAHVKKMLAERPGEYAAIVLEPRVQGAAGMIMHPHGFLQDVVKLAHQSGVKVILDEVMTGFGRTGSMFAFEHEDARPDVLCLAKGITGGYLPMAATLVTEEIFDGFRGSIERTFYHGHSYTGNQLGAAAALANLDILRNPATLQRIQQRSKAMHELSKKFWEHPNVGDVRQEGLILGVELVEDWRTREPFPYEKRVGYYVCEQARKYGLLTRAVGNVITLIPPYCATEEHLEQMVNAILSSMHDLL